jgi:hypothetical protein
MPHNDPDPTDPMALHGVAVQTDDPSVMREMAQCFIEEYLRMGYARDRVLSMFSIPRYAGPYMACQALGREAIAALIDDIASRWGGRYREPAPEEVPRSGLKMFRGGGG